MSKIIVIPSSLDHMYELTSYNIDGFIVPIKNLSVNQSFEVDYKDLELKIVESYGYTDVVGLTREEFARLKKLLEKQ